MIIRHKEPDDTVVANKVLRGGGIDLRRGDVLHLLAIHKEKAPVTECDVVGEFNAEFLGV